MRRLRLCPKDNPNFRDITRKVQENEILQEIFRLVYLVFTATFRVISRNIDYLWDSVIKRKLLITDVIVLTDRPFHHCCKLEKFQDGGELAAPKRTMVMYMMMKTTDSAVGIS